MYSEASVPMLTRAYSIQQPTYKWSSKLSWLQRRLQACVGLKVSGSNPDVTLELFVSIFQLALYQCAPLFCLLVFRTGSSPLEVIRIKWKRPTSYVNKITTMTGNFTHYKYFSYNRDWTNSAFLSILVLVIQINSFIF